MSRRTPAFAAVRRNWLLDIDAGGIRRACGIPQSAVAHALGVSQPAVCAWESGRNAPVGAAVIWRKPQGTGLAADRFRRVHESAVHWYRGEWRRVHHETPRIPHAGPDSRHGHHGANQLAHLNEVSAKAWVDDGMRLAPSVIDARNMHRRGAIHPTEKPVPVLRPLIAYACPPGGLVVAPFAGSGSDLEAARDLGCRAIGVEVDEEMCELAARRMSQVTLFGGEAS